MEYTDTDMNEVLDILRELTDLQNGSPLIKYEKEWELAMANAYGILGRYGK